MDEVKRISDRVLEVLRAKGAEGDAWIEERRSVTTGLRDGKVESIEQAQARGLAVRAMKEGRLGFCHTNRVSLEGAADAATKACELAGAGSPRDDLVLAPAAGPGDGSDEGVALQRFDDAITRVTPEQRADWLRRAEAAARKFDPRVVRTEGAGWTDGSTSVWIANTNGLFRHFRSTNVTTGIGVIAEEKGEMQSGGDQVEGTHLAHVPDPEAAGRKAGEKAIRLLGATPAATGRYPVVFSPDAGFSLLVYLSVALNGNNLSRERSWLAQVLKESKEPVIGSSFFTVKDEPRNLAGPARAPFDGEGIDTRNQTLVGGGRVRGSLCDLASGKRLGSGSTGSSNRGGYEALPDIGPRNFFLEPGPDSAERILSSVDGGLWVWGLTGWWIGMDPSNEQYSSAASGLWIEKGKPVRPVARVTIAGSLREIFGAIDAVASDLTWTHGTRTPTFRVKEMAVSGV